MILQLSQAFLGSNLAFHFRSDDMAALGRERIEAYRGRKYFLLDQKFFVSGEAALEQTIPSLASIPSLFLSSLSMYMTAYVCTDLRPNVQLCSMCVLLLSEFCPFAVSFFIGGQDFQ